MEHLFLKAALSKERENCSNDLNVQQRSKREFAAQVAIAHRELGTQSVEFGGSGRSLQAPFHKGFFKNCSKCDRALGQQAAVFHKQILGLASEKQEQIGLLYRVKPMISFYQ
jgi:hypothetical protein